MSIYTNGYWAYRGSYRFIGTTVPAPNAGTGSLQKIKLPAPYDNAIEIYPWSNNEAEAAREMALQLRPYEPLTFTKAGNYFNNAGINRNGNPFMLGTPHLPCVMGIPCAPQTMPNEKQIKGFLAYRAFMDWFLYVTTINLDVNGIPLNKVFACPSGNCAEGVSQYMFHRLKTGSGAGFKYMDPVAFRQKLKDPAFLAPTFSNPKELIKKASTPKKATVSNKRKLTPLKGKK